jgi:hypothetical protein
MNDKSRKAMFAKIHGEPKVGTISGYGKNKKNVTMSINLKHNEGTKMGTDGKKYTNPLVLSISGSVWNGNHSDIIAGGQMNKELEKALLNSEFLPKGLTHQELKRLLSIWDNHHSNDMNAGDDHQNKILSTHKNDLNQSKFDSHYDYAQALLKKHNANPHNGYSYGNAWLYKPIPTGDIAFIKSMQQKMSN